MILLDEEPEPGQVKLGLASTRSWRDDGRVKLVMENLQLVFLLRDPLSFFTGQHRDGDFVEVNRHTNEIVKKMPQKQFFK